MSFRTRQFFVGEISIGHSYKWYDVQQEHPGHPLTGAATVASAEGPIGDRTSALRTVSQVSAEDCQGR